MQGRLASVDEEYRKYKELKREDVSAMLDWTEKQGHLPKINELKMIFFLQSCFFQMEPTKTCIEKYYTTKARCPEFFSNRNLDAIRSSLESVLITILPNTTRNGSRVMLLKFLDTDPDKYEFNQHIKAIDMIVTLTFMLLGTSLGQMIILDMEGASFSHLMKINLIGMKKYMYYLQEALHARIDGIHITNATNLTDKLLGMAKPFIRSDLFESIHVHTKMDTLYKYVPREILPKEYGGFGDTVHDMKEKSIKMIEDNLWFFAQEEKEVIDENKRQGKPSDVDGIFGIHGSFKKLDID